MNQQVLRNLDAIITTLTEDTDPKPQQALDAG